MKTARRAILIRADSGAEIGTGHVMRMLALAQGWIARGGEVFLHGDVPPALASRLAGDGVQVTPLRSQRGSADDMAETLACARDCGAAWLALDGYHFAEGFQSVARRAGLRVLFVDDYAHAGGYVADLVLNQNFSARTDMYARRGPQTRLLLGPQYVLLRKEFAEWRSRQREVRTPASRMLVTLGGGDAANLTGALLTWLAASQREALEIQVVVGAVNPHREALQAMAGNADGKLNISIVDTTQDMASRMGWADVAIAAAGSTCWELAFMGLPALLLIVADNQEENARELEARGLARVVDARRGLDGNLLHKQMNDLVRDAVVRKALSSGGRFLVDGLGVDRVLDEMDQAGRAGP